MAPYGTYVVWGPYGALWRPMAPYAAYAPYGAILGHMRPMRPNYGALWGLIMSPMRLVAPSGALWRLWGLCAICALCALWGDYGA